MTDRIASPVGHTEQALAPLRIGYVFDTRFPDEDERLELGEALWDSGTQVRLAATGVSDGWRCLEVGAGRGSVAEWLTDLVGPSGTVEAVDLRTDRLAWLTERGVRIRRHDVTADELPRAAYDLVHARLVVQHIADRPGVVRRLCRALKPGGHLVLEDTDTASLFSHPTRPDFLQDVKRAAYQVMCDSGYHPRCGLLDAELATAAGLVDVHSEGRSTVVHGGSDAARWYMLWLDHLRPAMLARTGITEHRLDQATAELNDPANSWLSQVMVTVTGRAPMRGGYDNAQEGR
jgi:SAM-dependent methyltransferase